MIPSFDTYGNIPEHSDFYRPPLKEFIDRFVNVKQLKQRQTLYSKYLRYCNRFKKILLKVWIDGSYTTDKEMPSDMDVTVHYDALKLEKLRIVQFIEKKKFLDQPYIFKTYKCHTQYVPVYPKNDMRYALTEIQFNKWKKHFTKDKKGNPKGLIEISVF
jgi:hypothetical protein